MRSSVPGISGKYHKINEVVEESKEVSVDGKRLSSSQDLLVNAQEEKGGEWRGGSQS